PHSPYILASINNLILANKVAQHHPKEVQGKINKNLWIKRDKVYAPIIKMEPRQKLSTLNLILFSKK
ncbi:MAG: hypothetical protein LUC96_08265, partial [Alistipes sp.]|uniref:hypothetical protein n=1 Tax=Alistipes sp. TaxID=1872444 RepID=UPI0025B92B3B